MKRPPARPLTLNLLVRAAQTYLSRRAASRVQIGRVLLRKAQRSVDPNDEVTPASIAELVEAAVDQVARAGWLNDAALAETRAAALARNGLPARTVRRRLADQGLELADSGTLDVSLDDEQQARRYAERKRLGPFASGRRPPSPDRDVRALVRAGFSPHLSIRVLRELAAEINGPDRESEPI